jgi:hypothetical protein
VRTGPVRGAAASRGRTDLTAGALDGTRLTISTDVSGLRIAVANWRDPWHPQAGGAERYAWEMARALHGMAPRSAS